jgi:Ca-activated chloride channel homolog
MAAAVASAMTITTRRALGLLPFVLAVAGLTTALLLAAAGAAHGQVLMRARTERAAAVPAGDAGLPLVGESLRVTIDRQFARTVIEQAYQNEMGGRTEGQALVRAGAGARVQGFAYWNGKQKIVGEVFEKDVARRVYQDTTGLERDPGLLEEVGEGAFVFRVFPIEPGERKRIEVALGQRLVRTGSRVTYRMPVSLHDTDIVVDIDDSRPLARVTSPTHALSIEALPAGGQRVRARALPGAAAAAATTAPRELVLSYDVDEKAFTPGVSLHRDAGQDAYLMLSMSTPAATGAASAKDVTLVLDHSGSMQGAPMIEARTAAAAVVARLSSRDRVNVIAFDHSADLLYPTPRSVSPAVRREALDYIARIREEGGTNIGEALGKALAAQIRGEPGRPHIVLLLTDGQSDPGPVFETAKQDSGDARVFTIGLGPGVNKPLLARLGAMKRGRFTYIESAEAIKARVERLFVEIEAPLLVGVQVELEGGRLDRRYPATVPDLAAGDELVLAARASGSGPVTLKVSGLVEGKPVTFRTSFDLPSATRRPWVGRLWAVARVDDLQQEIALSGETAELKDEIVDLALAYNFVTPYTSFLAIPASELTAAAKNELALAREKKSKVLAVRADAAALSRDEMPPGDPVLMVAAPADARQVTAYFPFGLVKDLAWDARNRAWKTRFLVPNDVADGTYAVKVLVVHADGAQQTLTASYKIDSAAPDFTVETRATAGGARIVVTAAERMREVTVALVADPQVRVRLARAGGGGGKRWSGVLPLPAGTHELRVVVADRARNEAADTTTVTVGR